MPKRRKPPSQTGKTFLENHGNELVSIDFFTLSTATFRVLFVLGVLSHHRRRVTHFNVTERPTALWTGQQIVEAVAENSAPRYLLRDRDEIYGRHFRERIQGMNIEEVLSAPASPWQRAYVERLIGCIRRDCLDHVIILGERHLRTILRNYRKYFHSSRTDLALAEDTPEARAVQPPELGAVVEHAIDTSGEPRRRFIPFNQLPTVWSAVALITEIFALEAIDAHHSLDKTATSGFVLKRDGTPQSTDQEAFHS